MHQLPNVNDVDEVEDIRLQSRMISLFKRTPQLAYRALTIAGVVPAKSASSYETLACKITRQFHSSTSPLASNGSTNGSLLGTAHLDLEADYHKVTDETLERLNDFLAPLEEDDETELEVSMGVLKLRLISPQTSSFEKLRGQSITWVINKQTPNRQLWWSSPISGPRRYEWQPSTGSSAAVKDGLQIVSNWKYTRTAAIPGAANGTNQSNSNGSNGSKAGGKEEFDLLHQLHSEVLAVTGINLLK